MLRQTNEDQAPQLITDASNIFNIKNWQHYHRMIRLAQSRSRLSNDKIIEQIKPKRGNITCACSAGSKTRRTEAGRSQKLMKTRVSRMAVSSIIVDLLGLVAFSIALAGGGVIFTYIPFLALVAGMSIGLLALIRINLSSGTLVGKAYAIAGITLSFVCLVLVPLLVWVIRGGIMPTPT